MARKLIIAADLDNSLTRVKGLVANCDEVSKAALDRFMDASFTVDRKYLCDAAHTWRDTGAAVAFVSKIINELAEIAARCYCAGTKAESFGHAIYKHRKEIQLQFIQQDFVTASLGPVCLEDAAFARVKRK